MRKAKNEILAQGVSETNISLSLRAQYGTKVRTLPFFATGQMAI